MELLILAAVAWLLSPIGLGVALLVSRRQRRRAQAAAAQLEVAALDAPGDTPGSPRLGALSPRDVTSLLVLQHELDQQLEAGGLDAGAHQDLSGSLQAVWVRQLAEGGYSPDTGKWRSRLEEAWTVFVRQLPEPPGAPPWQASPEPEKPRETIARAPVSDAAPIPSTPHPPTPAHEAHPPTRHPPAHEPYAVAPAPPEPAPIAARADDVEASPAADPPPPATSFDPPHPATPADAEPAGTAAFAFAPAVPSALAEAVEVVSGWPRLVAPFLVQNIGWFIGGFCFVAGTLFLLSVTTGFVNALVILASLAVYTGFLSWAGYAIRRKSPDLRTSGNVLLTISMLLAPLNLTAGVHLITAALGSGAALGLAVALVAGQCAALLVAARFVNALVDRSLPDRHAQLFAALGALQLAAPLVTLADHWLALAAAHLGALALIGWGLLAFARDWVRSIFVDRRMIAYYAAGLLVFAGLVSFVQLARAYPSPLPQGYLGPFLMALCAMLFHVDAALKELDRKHPFLSRFTFALYGLSVVALLVCFDAPGPRVVSLLLAVATYGQVLWRYSSVPALYLLLAALGWLYGSLALEPLAPELHLLASLPGLAGLLALLRWAERRSAALATVCLRAFGLACVTLTTWSLAHGEPGPIAFVTGAAATLGVVQALRSAPWLLRAEIGEGPVDLNRAPWYYVVAALAALTFAYAPALPWLSWAEQLAFALLGLGTAFSWVGMRLRPGASRTRTEASLNCAILALVASSLLGASAAAAQFPISPLFAAQLALTACVVGWLSVELRARWLFYAVLAALGATALILKRTYFDAPSFGHGELLGALGLWALVWWLDTRHEAADGPGTRAAGGDRCESDPLRVLWAMPIARTRMLANGVSVR